MTTHDTNVRSRVVGLGPHGEHAASPEQLLLDDADIDRARAAHFTVGVALHTTTSDWARQQLLGIEAGLSKVNAALVQVIDCRFDPARQAEALQTLVRRRPDAVISIPIGNALAAEPHKAVARAGIRLVLVDNAPTGMVPGRDYATVVSADNFGLGSVAAELLGPHVRPGGTVLTVAYGIDFFATNERELAFGKWIAEHRSDVSRKQVEFEVVTDAGRSAAEYVAAHPEIDAVFVVWDVPAMQVVAELRALGVERPVITVDLGNEAALEMARGGLIKGVGAQRPYDQGVAEANAAILALLGREPPPWVALPAIAVTPDTVLDSYRTVWHTAAPVEVIAAHRASTGGGGAST